MDKVSVKLTVYFEDPFWVGVFERRGEGKLSVCKVTFGSEPKEYEVNEFLLKNYYRLRFSPAVASEARKSAHNPKRAQREAHRQTESVGIGTKSQQALKLQQEQFKTERMTKSRERHEAEKERRFELKQQKKKKKHRGR